MSEARAIETVAIEAHLFESSMFEHIFEQRMMRSRIVGDGANECRPLAASAMRPLSM